MKYCMSGCHGEERGGSKAIFFFHYEYKGKTSKQIWGTMINIFGDQENNAKIFGIKGT